MKRKSCNELITWLFGVFKVEEVPISHFSRFYIEYLNNLTCTTRKNRKILFNRNQRMISYAEDLDSCSYIVYRLLSSNDYCLQHVQDFFKNSCVVFEKETGYITTDNPWLSLVMCVVQGVSQEERENNTISWVDYCSCLEHLINGDY